MSGEEIYLLNKKEMKKVFFLQNVTVIYFTF